MRIQPIESAGQAASFDGARIRKVNIKPRVRKELTPEQRQERNYIQAIMIALAFIAASLTKCFIDTCNAKHKKIANTQVISNRPAGTEENTLFIK